MLEPTQESYMGVFEGSWITRTSSMFFKDFRYVFRKDDLGLEIAQIAFPTVLALMADPIASLVDTGFIGHLGPVEQSAVGVAIAIFNQVSRIATIPLVNVMTSFVAEEDTARRLASGIEEYEAFGSDMDIENEMTELIRKDPISRSSSFDYRNDNVGKLDHQRKHIPSASLALIVGGILGLLQTLFLILTMETLLKFMGVKSDSLMFTPALKYLTLRSLGAPAVLLSLAMQGVFRGLKDAKTPLYATIVGDVTNIVLDPILIFVFSMGVTGAAIAHIASQYLISLILLFRLIREVDLLPPSIKDLQFGRFLRSGFLLLVKVLAATFSVTVAASLAAREGAVCMAAFQVCLQIWMTTSLLTDGLAVAGQAVLASAFAERDYEKVKATASRVLQMGMVTGLGLSFILGVGLQFAMKLFSKDVNVLQLMSLGIPFVAVTQPINSLAFVFDGVNYGASDFAYSAFSMVLVALASIPCLFLLASNFGFTGIWVALTIYMSLRVLAGFCRIGTASGPWNFLRN